MTAPTLDARKHAEALKVDLKAALNSQHVYDYDEVPGVDGNPGPLPGIFALISVELVPSTNRRMTGQSAVRRWIASVSGLGETVDESRWALAKIAGALYEKRLTVDGTATSPLLSPEPGQAPRREDGRYIGRLIFTYSH